MLTFFLATGALGVAVLLLQSALSLFGFDQEMADDADLGEGLGLLSVRAVSAGAAAFGLGGVVVLGAGQPVFAAVIIGGLLGAAAAAGTAWLTRQMLRLESSGSLRIEGAVGRAGTVHLSIPSNSDGAGKVQFELQGRTVEMKAVTAGERIPVGSAVTIVGVLDGDTVEVMPTPTLKEILG